MYRVTRKRLRTAWSHVVRGGERRGGERRGGGGGGGGRSMPSVLCCKPCDRGGPGKVQSLEMSGSATQNADSGYNYVVPVDKISTARTDC